MDLHGLVDYEYIHNLELVHPATDQPVGVTFQIRSAGSEQAKAVLRAHTNKQIERNIKGRKPTSEQIEQAELEKAASYITSWNWGENTYEGSVPEFSMKRAMEIMEKEGWIYAQVVEAANKIENFTEKSRKPSAQKSK